MSSFEPGEEQFINQEMADSFSHTADISRRFSRFLLGAAVVTGLGDVAYESWQLSHDKGLDTAALFIPPTFGVAAIFLGIMSRISAKRSAEFTVAALEDGNQSEHGE